MKLPLNIILILLVVLSSCATKEVEIEPNQRGVRFKKFDGGVDTSKVYLPGKYKIPDYDRMEIYSIDPNKVVEDFKFETKDGQKMIVTLDHISKPIPNKIALLHDYIGRNYLESVVSRGIDTTIKNYFKNYSIKEIVDFESQNYNSEIFQEAQKLIKRGYIDLESIQIKDIIQE